jgi:hypothetical protein
LIHALELVDDAEALADHLHGGAGAARGGFPAAEDEQARFVEAGMAWMASASAAAISADSVKPLAGPSSAMSSKGTFWATVIMTCWSLALGPRLTSHTLLPGCCFARLAASKSAWPAHGSRTAGSISSFFRAGPAGTGDGLKGLQRIRHEAAADDDLVGDGHGLASISGFNGLAVLSFPEPVARAPDAPRHARAATSKATNFPIR